MQTLPSNGTSTSDSNSETGPGSLAPTISLPKGGGAIRGLGEKFAANPVTGTGSMTVPITVSPGRSGFGPELSLSYDSAAGVDVFGFGWSLSLPAITRKTDKGLPRYDDAHESDVFILSGSEDLVPVFRQDPDGSWTAAHPGYHRDPDGGWVTDPADERVVWDDDIDGYHVRRYRPRIEGLFARIERWTKHDAPDDVHWRSLSKDNVLTVYGADTNSRIADPAAPARIFSWLIAETRDDKGNAVLYQYKPEDGAGVDLTAAHESNRGPADDPRRRTNRHPKRILYGNRTPLLTSDGSRPRFLDAAETTKSIADGDWMFEVVFDYRDHNRSTPTPQDDAPWTARSDAFSSYRAGFEVRTARLCRRVLMFHHFPHAPDVGRDCLVRSTDLTYTPDADPAAVDRPVYAFLASVTQTGYRRSPTGGYDRRSFPPIDFTYSQPVIGSSVETPDPESLDNLPIGLDGAAYRWIDLHGQALTGILTEQDDTWYYKRNLSAAPQPQPDGQALVRARFGPSEVVTAKPNVSLSNAELLDLAGDGLPDIVTLTGPTAGFYEHNQQTDDWAPFRPFPAHLNIDLRDPNVRTVDLNGDGHADVLLTEDDAIVWYPSLAEQGFGAAQRVTTGLNERSGPRVVFATEDESIYLADLSGDGLSDLARIRNGEVCYWPNLGYGRFGAKVTMDNAPWFDRADQFNPKRVLLADVDGTGTTDFIYLHPDGVRLYFNQSGNTWSRPHTIAAFPAVHNLANIVAVDLLGNGTSCLVWSSPTPVDARCPLRYLNLMGEGKPHLLITTANNLGAETRIHYAPSTKFYLQDEQAGRRWITRLPFPVHVVERVETYDHISRNRFSTRYAYSDGYFDPEEREFRGFGRVDQWDTELITALTEQAIDAANVDNANNVPPVHTITWFHTGIYTGRDQISRHYEKDYFREPGLSPEAARPMLLDDTTVDAGLAPDEAREACRALKGTMLRQELYAYDVADGVVLEERQRAETPYTVTEQNFTIHTVQHRGGNRHGVFLTHTNETLSYHYERNPADPRIQHTMTLESDGYGNVLKQAAIGYGRRTQIRVVDQQGDVRIVPNAALPREAADQAKQTTALLTYTESRVTNAVTSPDTHRNPLPCEAITFELIGYTATGPATGPADIVCRFQASDFVEPDPAATGRLRNKFTAPEVPYEATPAGNQCRRPIEWVRTLYRSDDLETLLPLGELESLALAGESYKLAFTPGLLVQVFQRPHAGQTPETLLPDPAAVLAGQAGNQGGYRLSQALKADGRFPSSDADDHWWIPSGQSFFSTNPADNPAIEATQAREHFFLPRRYRDPFGQNTFVDLDANDLLMAGTRDALDNRITVDANDYRVLQPRLVSDPNRNQTEVAFDILGMVVGTAVMGKPLPALAEGDTLSRVVTDPTQPEIDTFFAAADPHRDAPKLLGDATTRIVYDLGRFRRTQLADPSDPATWQPACAATLARETHSSAPLPPQGLKIQLSFSYSDGFGREIQRKLQAEPGPVVEGGPVVSPRWVGTGWTIFNNKGKPVRQYEPFFSATHRFEFGAQVGVSPVLFYDATERVIATLHPNHTYEKVVFNPWQQTIYDVNDTCAPRGAQTGDPRTDSDIGGYVAEYFKTQPPTWQTWHAQRIGGSHGQNESDAALRAEAHADTPTTVHFDALGRPFLNVGRNRVVSTGHALDGTEENLATRVELDIEGNQRAVFDERKLPVNHLPTGAVERRIAMRYAYDMLGNRIYQLSMEAGARWMLNDAAGKPIRAWDSRGHNFTTTNDALRRPVEQVVRGTSAESDPRTVNRDLIVDKIEYGEGVATGEALNLRTRIYRHFDSAGVVANERLDAAGNPTEAYDFKGNLLNSTRRLASDHKAIPDWALNPQLDAEIFESSTRYDALNRPVQLIAPHSNLARAKRSVIQPVFNEANLLDRVDVWLERATEPGALIDPTTEQASPVGVLNIDYDAKGQRLLIDYKNGASTRYRYDPETFRLVHLNTRRGTAFTEDCDNPTPPPPAIAAPHTPPDGKSCGLLNLYYTYDPAGNITHIRDDAQQAIYFRNKRVKPSNDYTYDALYRLIQATGREHLGQGGAPIPHSPNDAGRVGLLSADAGGRFAPNDGNAMGTYIERYVYDAVGNLLQMQHAGSDANLPGWSRRFTYNETSLIEGSRQSNRLSSAQVGNSAAMAPETYLYDAHGDVVRMPHLGGGLPGPNMHWNYKDELRQTDLGGGGTAYYVYDASGQRVRKVCEKMPGLTEERIYLGGFEIFRIHNGPIGADTATLERETLHVMDEKQRIALVETRTLDAANKDHAPRQFARYQVCNHLASSNVELDEQAQVISYEEYAPYGSSTYQAVRSQTETAKRYRYTGKERDEETGLYYSGARSYAPWLARWTSADPHGVEAGPNVYAYCRNRPTMTGDTNGMLDDEAKGVLQRLQQIIDQIPQKEFAGLSRSEQGGRAHLTLESIISIDPKSPARVATGVRLAPEVIVDAAGMIVDFGEPGKAQKGFRTIDAALLKSPVADVKDLIGKKASDVIEAAIDYKTGGAKLKRVGEMEELIKGPYVKAVQGGDLLGAVEAKTAKMLKGAAITGDAAGGEAKALAKTESASLKAESASLKAESASLKTLEGAAETGGLLKAAGKTLGKLAMAIPVLDVVAQQVFYEQLGYGFGRPMDAALNLTVAEIWDIPIAVYSVAELAAKSMIAGGEAATEAGDLALKWASEKSGLSDVERRTEAGVKQLYGVPF